MASEGHWSELPKELLSMIAKRLDSDIDILRFRSICTQWRSSTPPHQKTLPQFPYPISPSLDDLIPRGSFTVAVTTIYALEPLDESPKRRYLIKVEEDHRSPGKVRLMCPLSSLKLTYLPKKFPKVLNLSDYQIFQLHKSNTYRHPMIKKLLVMPSNPEPEPERTIIGHDCVAMVLVASGRLAVIKSGHNSWIPIDNTQFCKDIIIYKGNFYVINGRGTVSVMGPNLRLIEFPPSSTTIYGDHLVESAGDLLLVQGYAHQKVYRLREDQHRWVELTGLGDRMLFVSEDYSFSISARDFFVYNGNCIFYTNSALARRIEKQDEVLRGLQAYNAGVFDLGSGRVWQLTSSPWAKLFWPPATLLAANPFSSSSGMLMRSVN